MRDFAAVADGSKDALQACGDIHAFSHWLRQSGVSNLACEPEQEGAATFLCCFDALFEIGRDSSIPFGIAACMHLYMLAAIAKFPLSDVPMQQSRAQFLSQVRQHRLLLANSGSDANLRSSNHEHSGTRALLQDGRVIVNGEKTFVTMASVADLLIFTAAEASSGQMLSLYTQLRDNPALRLQAPLDGIFARSGTHSVQFHNLSLGLENVISGVGAADAAFQVAHLYQRSWFQGLVGAVYLGALTAALGYVINFAHGLRLPDASHLAQADGFVLEIGRLQARLQAALQLRYGVADALRNLEAEPQNVAHYHTLARAASLAKYISTDCAEQAAPVLRKLVGLRSFESNSRLAIFSTDVMFGQLHPELAPLFERALGQEIIGRVAA